MAATANDPEFWLPSEFLTEDDILMDIENFNKNGLNTGLGPNFCFPTEFPYDCGFLGSSSLLSSPVGSPVDSTESESDKEDLLNGLTHHTLQEKQKPTSIQQNIEKSWVRSSSPQSTLNTVESWSGRRTMSSNRSPKRHSQVSSLQTTPVGGNNEAWDLIYQAAGQVARLKMNGDGPPKTIGHLGPPWSLNTPLHPSPHSKCPNSSFYKSQCPSHTLSGVNHFQVVRQKQMVKQLSCNVWGRQGKEDWFSLDPIFQDTRRSSGALGLGGGAWGGGFVESRKCGRLVGMPQSTWPPLQAQHNHHHHHQHHNQQLWNSESAIRAVPLGESSRGSGVNVKRECTGTGVFLPRRYSNPLESGKKQPGAGCSTVLLPAKAVQYPNKKNFLGMTVDAQPLPLSCVRGVSISDHDLLVSRTNALFAQQKPCVCPGRALMGETCLPQEWTC